MDKLYPIYTEKTECMDCYKCVRECPVKAISFENGHARVDHERCIFCGKCVYVCPAGAKRARSEVSLVQALLKSGKRVVLSIAPSFAGEFPGLEPARLIGAAKKAGFYGVSETAIGAEAVSMQMAAMLEKPGGGIFISSACPSVVEYVNKYKNSLMTSITGVFSPMLAHCRMIKNAFGDDTEIVFVGPCLSKKLEADAHSELCRSAITFDGFRRLLSINDIDLFNAPESEDGFLMGTSGKSSQYPYEGGMIDSIKALMRPEAAEKVIFMSFSGVEEISMALSDIPEMNDRKLFLELLACRGGCINGPKSSFIGETIRKRLDVLRMDKAPVISADFPDELSESWRMDKKTEPVHSEEEIIAALHRVGKYTKTDELNCGGCGYNTCREFAAACLDGKAEPVMCVSHMRRLAQKKANMIIERMPSAVVIVDDKLKILDCNRRFAEILGEEALMMWESKPSMEGAILSRLVPFHDLFSTVLRTGSEIIDKHVEYGKKILNVTVFPIIERQSIGAIIQDITIPYINRDNIIKKAEDVIRKNLETVQKIAYLLGENAAENEVILNSIIESFGSGQDD